jgi:hypothetical protein
VISAVLYSKKPIIRVILLNIGAILIIFSLYEAYLYTIKPNNYPIIEYVDANGHQKDYYEGHDIFGHRPIKYNAVTARSLFNEKVIFEVTYTINSQGLRINPPSNNVKKDGCILFFGGSFTFGEGVNDNQAMPYLVEIKSEGKYTTYNFGVQAYGPHHMLAALEQGFVESIINCEPKYAIFQTMTDHVIRAAGMASWEKFGPRYILDQNGQAVFAGQFNYPDTLSYKLKLQLEKSLIISRIISRYRTIDNEHIDLFAGILDKAKRIIDKRYHDCQFHVIFWDNTWDNENGERDKVLRKLSSHGFKVHLISDILPDYNENVPKYRIEHDGHPNALAHDQIADYVVKNILNEQ